MTPNSRTNNGSGCPCCAGKIVLKENSLAYKYPEVAKEWHPMKNNGKQPSDFSYGSDKKVWWLCKKGHEFPAYIKHRTISHSQCPYCSRNNSKTAVSDSLAVKFPGVLTYWDYKKNEILPEKVAPYSTKDYWWTCHNPSHPSHLASPKEKVKNTGCPYCAGRLVCETNSLATLYPDIAKEWHPVKNGELTPNDVIGGSSLKVWWLCEKGHEFPSRIYNRTTNNRKCPYCANKKASPENCLAVTHPHLVDEWHPTKNGKTTPFDVLSGSSTKRWWKCSEKGHEFYTSPNTRTNPSERRKGGCPYCTSQLLSYETSLAYMDPELSREWHPTKNNGKEPSDFFANSNQKVWWLCEKGHEFFSSIKNRHNLKSGCPECGVRSYGEIIIDEVLTNHQINFEREKRFDDCKYKNPLPFDFYIASENTVIECHGLQHYEEGNGYFEGKLEEIQIRDNIKKEYCKKNGIYYMEVRYDNKRKKTSLKEIEKEIKNWVKSLPKTKL